MDSGRIVADLPVVGSESARVVGEVSATAAATAASGLSGVAAAVSGPDPLSAAIAAKTALWAGGDAAVAAGGQALATRQATASAETTTGFSANDNADAGRWQAVGTQNVIAI